jgi:hypothetical protein
MPKVSAVSQSLVAIVSLGKTPLAWEVNDWLLDSSGFPWAVHAILDGNGSLLLMPLRDLPALGHQIGTLIPYEEGIAANYLNRVFDYMSHIESLDLTVKSVRSGDWFESWGENEWVVDHDFKQDTTVAPNNTVVITDCNGIEWGPLPCDLAVAQDTWPYRGGIKSHDITFEPHKGHSDWWTLKMGKLQIDVHGSARLTQLILDLRDNGWLKMIENNFASGLKLESVGHVVSTAGDDNFASLDG